MNFLKGLSAVAFLLIFLVPITSTAAPIPVPVAKVSGGEDHTLILTEANTVWSCGHNGYRQLGDGTNKNRYVPVEVNDGEMNTDSNFIENIVQIAAGMNHSLALDTNNHVWAWGDNGYGQLGNPNPPISYSAVPIRIRGGEQGLLYLQNIIYISIGRSGQHSLAIDANHYVWAWGISGSGQLGNGAGEHDHDSHSWSSELAPVQVHAGQQTPGEPNAYPLRYIIKVSGGEEHSMALDVNGCVYTWGDNEYYPPSEGRGKLGINNTWTEYITTPVKVHGVNDVSYLKNIVAISAGWDHSMALEKIDHNDPNCKGRVYTWGNNRPGFDSDGDRLGDGTGNSSAVPVIVHAGEQDPNHPDTPLKNIIAIAAGEGHCIALEKLDVNDSNCRGRVYTWGDNKYGQLGTGDYQDFITPIRVFAPDRDGDGQPDDLDGNPNTTDYLGDDIPIVYISTGYWHNLVVDQSGQTYVWGKGLYGRLGIGQIGIGPINPTDNINTPVPLHIYDLNVHNETQGKWYKRIQPAINEANSNNVIEVYEGYYCENLNINKSITLKSRDPNNQSVVDNTRIYGSEQMVITLTNNNNNSIVTGFTITTGSRGISCTTNGSNPMISHCRILDNVDDGIYLNGASAVITNNLIYHNGNASSVVRAGISLDNSSSSTQIRNNTIVGNKYGIYKGSGNDPNINSNIIWGNTSGSLYPYGGGSFNRVNYNCIKLGGQCSYSGKYNINSDPCFRDPNANDYHLKYNSPCIDKGDPNFNSSTEKDIDGENRVMDSNSDGSVIVDMGADEFCPFDLSSDGFVNFLDFAVFAKSWMKSAGSANYNDRCDFNDNNKIDYSDLYTFCAHWLWPSNWGDYFADSFGGQMEEEGEEGESSLTPVDANIIIRIVDINDNNEITINVGESITLYLRLTTTEQGSLGIFDVEAMISDTNLGFIDNREYNPDDPNDPNNGTARILAEPRYPSFDYVGPGYEQPEGIALFAASLGADFNDGNLAGFVFTCGGQGDVTLSLKNYLTDTYPKLESILIHQVEPNSQQMMMGGGGIEMESSSAAMESSQMSEDVDVDELAAWLDQLWQTDETVRDSISEADWQEFVESVRSSE